jgi:hypothetical protein
VVRRCVVALLLLAPVFGRTAVAQQPAFPPVDSTTVVEMRLSDGSTVVGRVVAVHDSLATLLTAAGVKVVVPRRSLAGWRARSAGGFSHRDPNLSRLFLAPTGRTLRGGDGYFSDYYLFFPVVGYGIVDRVMLSAGMTIVPGLNFNEQLYYVAPKIGVIQSPSLSVSVGGLYMHWGWSDIIDAWGGVAYGVATVGSEDAALTAGLGWPFASGGTGRNPWAMLGGELRVSNGLKLLAEGWKFPGSDAVPAVLGIRFVGERIAVDFGMVRVFGVGAEMTSFVPWVDFVVNW